MNDENIEQIQSFIRENLKAWEAQRLHTLELLHKQGMPNVEEVDKLFRVADKLTELIEELFKVNHQLSADAVSVLSALILGLSNGSGIKEVELFFKFANVDQFIRKEGDELH